MTSASTIWRGFIGFATTVILGVSTWQLTKVVNLTEQMVGVTVRVSALEERQVAQGRGQEEARARGDVLRQDVSFLKSQMLAANSRLDSIDNKLDRLIERRFGDASQPTGGVSPELEGQPWQR